MVVDPDAYMRLMDDVPTAQLKRRSAWYLAAPKNLAWKSILLLVTTLAFVPILASKHELAASVYVVALIAVHVVGLIVIAAKSGVAWWRDGRGLVWRLAGIGILSVLLSILGKGLVGATGVAFWAALAFIWLLHTAGALLFHIRGDPRACPFI